MQNIQSKKKSHGAKHTIITKPSLQTDNSACAVIMSLIEYLLHIDCTTKKLYTKITDCDYMYLEKTKQHCEAHYNNDAAFKVNMQRNNLVLELLKYYFEIANFKNSHYYSITPTIITSFQSIIELITKNYPDKSNMKYL